MGAPSAGKLRHGSVTESSRCARPRPCPAPSAGRSDGPAGDGAAVQGRLRSVRRAARLASRSAARSGAARMPRGARRRGGRAGSGRAGPPQPRGSRQVRAGPGRGRCPPPEPPRRGGTQRDQSGGWVVAAGAVPPPPRSGAVPAAPNCGNGAGGHRPPPFILPPPTSLGTGAAVPRFPSDPIAAGRRGGPRSRGGGHGAPPATGCSSSRFARAPRPVVPSCLVVVWLHVAPPLPPPPQPLYPLPSVALGATFAPPCLQPLLIPGGTAGLREPPGAFGARCICCRAGGVHACTLQLLQCCTHVCARAHALVHTAVSAELQCSRTPGGSPPLPHRGALGWLWPPALHWGPSIRPLCSHSSPSSGA